MACPLSRARRIPQGYALVAVLWTVSALSLAAASLAAAMRTDLRLLQDEAQRLEAAALGDAAITAAALDLDAIEPRGSRIVSGEVELDGRRLHYRAWPAAGFVNPNTAPEPLVRDLLVHGGGLDSAGASLLARRILAWRTPDPILSETPGRGQDPPFRRRSFFAVPEDLLQVPGMEVELFARLRPLLSMWGPPGGGVDPLVAPAAVLAVLARGDEALAQDIARRRASEGLRTDLTRLEQAHLSRGSEGAVYRIEASVPGADGRNLLRAQWISLGAHERLPWRTLAVEPVVAAVPPLHP